MLARRKWRWVILAAVLPGCSRTPARTAGTGAREAVRDYYDALVQQNWQQAYDALDPESKQRIPFQEFTRLAQNYRRKIGFVPEQAHIQSCDEKGEDAIAHVVLMGQVASKQRRYKDAVVLRQRGDGWRVMLSSTFGR